MRHVLLHKMFAVKEHLSVGNFKKIQPEEATLYTIKVFGFLQRTFKNIQSKTERTYNDKLPIQKYTKNTFQNTD